MNSNALPELNNDEIKRYSRHLIMPEVGMDGQRRLKDGSVLCVGAGGLGSPAAMYLAAAGVGRIGIVDFDVVDFSNLQRQIIHGTSSVGRSKLASAKDRLADINPHIQIDTYEEALSSDNALRLFEPYDVILDGTDNFPTRYLTNDACVLLGKPNAYGSIFRFEGQASVFSTKNGPCYRCLYPEPPPPGLVPSCAEGGVLGVLPGVIGVIQATESIKLLTGIGEPLIGRFLIYDALRMRFRELKLRKDPDCPVCGTHPTVTKLIDYEEFCGLRPEVTEEQIAVVTKPSIHRYEITALELKARIDKGDKLTIIDVREPNEYQINRIAGSVLIPQGELPRRYAEFDPEEELIMQCKSGARSGKAADFLRSVGFKHVLNLKGGIQDWIDKVDPSQPNTSNIGLSRSDMLRLSKKADYALMAMKHLALRADGESSSAREIAGLYDIPIELLAKVLQRLVQRGLLASQQGTRGGYQLARGPAMISVADVIQAIDGPVAVTACSSSDDGSCEQFSKCNVRDPLWKVRERILAALGECTIAELSAEPAPVAQTTTRAAVFHTQA